MNQCDFPTFFSSLWGYDPFPWQTMLAERVAAGTWPQVLDLPTAAGKTACIDVALYALAAQAARRVDERTAPRRIWFVVDRRIVVDEAYARAQKIAQKLVEAKKGTLYEIAERLRAVGGLKRAPLSIARLRGGVLRDDGWARRPSQPAIITSTVDQLGSRLLFRGYGHSALTAPIYAGLAGNDSLVILDEAHCSVPFMQTLRAIEGYRGPQWTTAPVTTPFSFVMLSATPPAGIAEDSVFPGVLRDEALAHDVLHERMIAAKRAELVALPVKKSSSTDVLIEQAIARALSFAEQHRRVGVMVNRVRTAEEICAGLRQRANGCTDIVLLTGRMRPFERDRLVDRWKPYLRASAPEEPPRPVVLVSTQCLEVGADFSFDALVTEAASLDALRQRFGRLDRLGKAKVSPAAILIRDCDADPDKVEPDPIYGTALARTWKLLSTRAEAEVVDFGIEALRKTLSDLDDVAPYLAPSSDAPVLLPAHLDMLCQTAPRPEPEPDVGLFLHGTGVNAPDVQVLWRSDLKLTSTRDWVETVALCPPVTGEMLSVPLYRLRSWLAAPTTRSDAADIEGTPPLDEEPTAGDWRACVIWRGREKSRVARAPSDIAPGDIVVLPDVYGMQGLGQAAPSEAVGGLQLDLWEPAQLDAGRPAALRLNRVVLEPWIESPPVRALVDLVEDTEHDRNSLYDAIDAVLAYVPDSDESLVNAPPRWLLDLLKQVQQGLGESRCRLEEHPTGGVVVFAPVARKRRGAAEPDLFADDDDLMSAIGEAVSLEEHSELVQRTVDKIAARCVPESLRAVLGGAGYWHDVGKLDERFQVLLRLGDELAVHSADAPLAKCMYPG